MQYRTDFSKKINARTPEMAVFSQADKPHYAWVRFDQLSPVKPTNWQINQREHKESNGVKIPIVDPNSTGVIQVGKQAE